MIEVLSKSLLPIQSYDLNLQALLLNEMKKDLSGAISSDMSLCQLLSKDK